MNKKSLAIICGALVLIVGGTAYALTQNSDTTTSTASTSALKTAEPTTTTVSTSGDAMAKGVYADYSQAKLANATKGKVVLFFHAPWCPICREADTNFLASPAPDGLTLLKTDYDSSKELKKKYGVTYQHTYVQVDKDGNLIKKWNHSTNYEDIQNELN